MNINVIYNQEDKTLSNDNDKFNYINIKNNKYNLFQLIESITDIKDQEFYIIFENIKEYSDLLINNAEKILKNTKYELFFFTDTIIYSGEESIDNSSSKTNEHHLPSYILSGRILKNIQNILFIHHCKDMIYQERILTTILNKLYKPFKIQIPISFTYTYIYGRFNQISALHNDRNLYISNTIKFLTSVIKEYQLSKNDFTDMIIKMSSQRKRLFNFFLFVKIMIQWNFKSALSYINILNPIFFHGDNSKINDVEIISFKEFKIKRDNILVALSKIFDKLDIKSFPIGLSALGQIKFGFPIEYDDDIDISVERYKYLKNFNYIKEQLEKSNIYIQKWDERGGHNAVTSIDKVFEKKIYHIIDSKYNIDSIISPFIDITTFVNFSVDSLEKYEKFEKNMKILRRFSQNSDLFSTYRSRNLEFNSWVMEKSFKPLTLTPYKMVRKFFIKRSNSILKKINHINSNFTEEIYVYGTNFDSEKWGIHPIKSGKKFLGRNFYQYSDIDEVFFRRYGHSPVIYDDSNAVPSHLNYESINYLFNKNHWLNTKNIKKRKLINND